MEITGLRYQRKIDLSDRQSPHTLAVLSIPAGSRVLDVGAGLGDEAGGQSERDNSDRGVYEEDPLPRGQIGQDTAEQQAKHSKTPTLDQYGRDLNGELLHPRPQRLLNNVADLFWLDVANSVFEFGECSA